MVHIAVLIVPPIQLLDLAPIDLFAMLRTSYMEACGVSDEILAASLDDASFSISYVTDASGGNEDAPLPAIPTTASLDVQTTHDIGSLSLLPGKVGIVLIPGPPPGTQPSERVSAWLRAHVETGEVDLLTVCTGSYIAAFAGVLRGKKATGTRSTLGDLRKRFGKDDAGVEWVEKRWLEDGRVWTAGGITNGMDMVAMYIRKRWPGLLSETVLAMAEVDVRDQEYRRSKAV